MIAIITVKCANGSNEISCSTLSELESFTKEFDNRGTDYDINYTNQTESDQF
jgi:hypothetical protein